jgi:hypothetical protein
MSAIVLVEPPWRKKAGSAGVFTGLAMCAVTRGGQRAGSLYTITLRNWVSVTALKIINKLYIFVNNQFILNGIGIAKLRAASALLDWAVLNREACEPLPRNNPP